MAVRTATLSGAGAVAAGNRQSIAFVLPRADWIASNLSLMRRLASDSDVDVTLVAPVGYRLTEAARRINVIEYPFYEPSTAGSFVSRCAETYRTSRRRRTIVDSVFRSARPHCIVVISDTSRESLPFVRIARHAGVRVVLMQSVFLASPLRRHIRSENWTLAKRRGPLGIIRLLALRAVHSAAGLPATVFKPSSFGGYSDAVFVINDHQKGVFLETTPPDRVHVTGTPFMDALHAVVRERGADERRSFCAQIGCNPDRPIVAYFSKSLEQFCHADAGVERRAQEFFIDTVLETLPTATVVVKLHPIEDDRAFRKFAGHARVRVVKDLDVHQLIHHSALVISLGPSTPAFHAVFHDRPRLIITKVDDVVLEYQADLLNVSVCTRTRDEYSGALRQLSEGHWPEALPETFRTDPSRLTRFTQMFDGSSTERAHAGLREFLGMRPE